MPSFWATPHQNPFMQQRDILNWLCAPSFYLLPIPIASLHRPITQFCSIADLAKSAKVAIGDKKSLPSPNLQTLCFYRARMYLSASPGLAPCAGQDVKGYLMGWYAGSSVRIPCVGYENRRSCNLEAKADPCTGTGVPPPSGDAPPLTPTDRCGWTNIAHRNRRSEHRRAQDGYASVNSETPK